jgi:hypothetical protein
MTVDAFIININTSLDIWLDLHFNFKNIVLFQHLTLHSYLLLLLNGPAHLNLAVLIWHLLLLLHVSHCIVLLLLLILSSVTVFIIFDLHVNYFFLMQVANEIDFHFWIGILHLDYVKKVDFLHWFHSNTTTKTALIFTRCRIARVVILILLVRAWIVRVLLITVVRLIIHREATRLSKVHN